MDKFLIKGPTKLNGQVDISGSKNAALPIMTACLGKPGVYLLKNVPNLRDTRTMAKLLEIIGCKVKSQSNTILIDSTECDNPEAPYELVKTMRASFYVLGPLLSRFAYAKVSLPGGCAWGPRPIDYHMKAFEALGAEINLDSGYIETTGKLKGTKIVFPKPSVGATGNVLMACMNLEEDVFIHNASCEPEIVDLCNFLIQTGVSINGIGTDKLHVKGVKAIHVQDIDYTIIPDRIEAGTFMIACAMCGGGITINNVNVNHLDIVIDKLIQSGCDISIGENQIKIKSNQNINPVDIITDVYPGYPTDLQAQWIALMSTANGRSHVTDTIYNDRFTHVAELLRLGANISMDSNIAIINGIDSLKGAQVMSTDIRASASLIIAAMSASGETNLSRIYHIDRGYEQIENKLTLLGANIVRQSE